MYILLGMEERDVVRIVCFTKDQAQEYQVPAKNSEILTHIDACLAKNNRTLAEIKGIAVVVGAGTFTSTRLAVTVGNTIAYVQQIPIVAVSAELKNNYTNSIELCEKQLVGIYVSATYSGSPRIGN